MKRIYILIIAVCISISIASYCYGLGPAEHYKMTVMRLEAKKSDGTWITFIEPYIEVDVGQDAVGAGTGAVFLSGILPPGSYVNFKIVMSETVRVTGYDDNPFDAGPTRYTRADGSITITGLDANAASTATWPDAPAVPNMTYAEPSDTYTALLAQQGEVTVSMDLGAAKAGGDTDDFIEVYAVAAAEFSPPVTISLFSVVSMFYDFDTGNTIWYFLTGGLNNLVLFTPPKEGSRFGITVDGTAYTITEPNMRVDF